MPGSSAALRIQIWSGTERFSIDCKSTRHRWILQARPDHSSAGKAQGKRVLSVLNTEIHTERSPFLTPLKKTIPVPLGEEQQGKTTMSKISPPQSRWVQECTCRQEENISSNHFGSGNVPSRLIFDIKPENTLICMSRDNSKGLRWILSASSLKFR